MILPAEEHAQHTHFQLCFIRYEIEYGTVLGHMAQAIHDLRHMRALKRDIAQTGQGILDPKYPGRRAGQRLVNCIAKVAIGLKQVVKDRFDVCVAVRAAQNSIAFGHESWPRSCFRSGGALLLP